MNPFVLQQRVRVCDPDHCLANKLGTVVRHQYHNRGAWVAMDEDPPAEVREFPLDDPSGRGRWVILYPFECRPVVAVVPSLN